MGSTETETLADLIRAGMRRKGYTSLNQVEVSSGQALRRQTLRYIMNGQTQTIQPATIDALVTHLGIPRRRLLAATRTPPPGHVPAEPFVLPPEANLLTAKERRVIKDMVFALLSARGHGNGTAP